MLEYKKGILLITASMMLAACGGGSDDETDSGGNVQTNPVAVSAIDTVAVVSVGTQSVISVKDKVELTDQTASYKISDIKSLDSTSGCTVDEVNESNFLVTSNQTGLCNYQYTVSAANNEASATATAIAHVLVQPKVSSGSNFQLEPKLLAMDESQCQTIDVSSDIPTGYTLDDKVVTLGDGTSTANQPTDGSIQFCGESKGVSKIFYSASDEDGETYWGTATIAVSVAGNNNPEAANFSYYYDPASMTVKVPAEETITLDIADYVEDADEDSIQLVEASATNAIVNLADNTDVDNTKLTFKATTPGQYYVNYMVYDHHGGYDVATINIQASGPFQDYYVDTGDSSTSFTLTAPMIQGQYDSIGFEYTNTNSDDGYDMPLENYEMAEAICVSLGGALPTQAEATQAYNAAGSADWPDGKRYWVKRDDPDSDTAKVWNLNTNSFQTISDTSEVYFTCKNVEPGDFAIRDPHYVIAGTIKNLIARYTNSAGELSTYSRGIRWESSDPTILDIDETSGDAEGMKEGIVTVTATTIDGLFTDSIEVKVIEEIVVFGMGSLYNQSNAGFNIAVEKSNANNIVASNAMLQDTRNFGTDASSTVRLKANWVFQTARDYDYNSLIDALESDYPPAVVHIGYPNQPNAAATSAIQDFLYDGGVVMYFSQEDSPTRNMMEAVFGDDIEVGTFSRTGGGGVIAFNNIDDPVINGPFGDLRHKYWGVDQWHVSYVTNLPLDQYVPFSFSYDLSNNMQAGGSVGKTGVSALRHKTLKFIWTGDAGFLGYRNDNPSWGESQDWAFPLMVVDYAQKDRDDGDFRPADKDNYGTGTKYSVSNSTFYANAITWLFGAALNE